MMRQSLMRFQLQSKAETGNFYFRFRLKLEKKIIITLPKFYKKFVKNDAMVILVAVNDSMYYAK